MDQNTPPSTEIKSGNETVYLHWTAPIAPSFERGKKWYLAAGTFVILSGVFAAWTEAWSFLALLVLVTGAYIFFHKEEPAQKSMTVGKDGFQFGKNFIPWNECGGYWMLQGPGYIELHIERKNRFAPNVMIQTGPISVADIRKTFSEFLPEFPERKERLVDTIIRICKL